MLKLFRLTAFSLFVLSAFLGETAFGSPQPEKKNSPNVVESEKDVPICYIQTTSDTTLNLSSLCNQPKEPKVNSVPTPTPYNFTAIKKFNDEVYGKDN